MRHVLEEVELLYQDCIFPCQITPQLSNDIQWFYTKFRMHVALVQMILICICMHGRAGQVAVT